MHTQILMSICINECIWICIGQERDALLARADALLYTPDREHFGIVPIEAMNAGTPAICVASGGPLETILHGLSGFLCQQTAKDFGLAMKKFTIKSISDIERLKLTDTIAEYTKNGSKNRYSKIKKLNYLDKTLSLSQLMGLIGREHVQVGYTLILASYVENYCFFLWCLYF